MQQIPASLWNSLAGSDYPFLRHEYLAALEQSGCVSAQTGWQAQHLLVYGNGQLLAACPLYRKSHSHGEFVFDQQWAQAYQQAGLAYYPKWVTGVPFTPCASQRILLQPGIASAEVYQLLLQFIHEQAQKEGVSSWHCLFTTPAQSAALQDLGLLTREGVQFQWFNQQYRDFADYCATFTARRRKTILRERQSVKQQGIDFIRLPGHAISAQQWEVFFQFYQMTYLKHGMAAYLNLEFFQLLAQSMPEQLLLILACKAGKYVGAALSFVGGDTFYGRYWGCFEEYAFLHFECCYYQGLDYCLEHGLQRFDSGAQGEHKIARGFQPITTYSSHWLQHPAFGAAIAKFLQAEKQYLQQYRAECAVLLPFKKGDN